MSKIPKGTEIKISAKFQNRISALISDENCNKAVFASSVGISKDVINRAAIYGIIPSLKSLIRIADYLNLSIDYVLAESDEVAFYRSDKPSTFHVRLEELKCERKTSYSKIALIMPFSTNFFYEWLRTGTLPSLDYLKALAGYFEVSIDYLLGRTDEKD